MLPNPGENFYWIDVAGRPALVCRPLAPYAAHFFTTRSWLLGSEPGPSTDKAWHDVAAAAAVKPERLVRARQVHGVTVLRYHAGESTNPLPEADIIVTDDCSAAIAVQTADCAPILMVDPVKGAVAAVHAGWRGLAAGAPARGVRALAEAYGSHPDDLIVSVGPCIGACCYEVGGDVVQAFRDHGVREAQIKRWFSRIPHRLASNPPMAGVLLSGRDGKWFFDGWRASRDQLEDAGVRPDRAYVAELCTASHPGMLPSYRRDGRAAGRIAAVVRVTEAFGHRPSHDSPGDPRGH